MNKEEILKILKDKVELDYGFRDGEACIDSSSLEEAAEEIVKLFGWRKADIKNMPKDPETDDMGFVLCKIKDAQTITGILEHHSDIGFVCYDYEESIHGVTHWMPIQKSEGGKV